MQVQGHAFLSILSINTAERPMHSKCGPYAVKIAIKPVSHQACVCEANVAYLVNGMTVDIPYLTNICKIGTYVCKIFKK